MHVEPFLGQIHFDALDKMPIKAQITKPSDNLLLACVRFFVGNCGQHLRGCVGHHKTRHIFWHQCFASSETAAHLQSHQVSLALSLLLCQLIHAQRQAD